MYCEIFPPLPFTFSEIAKEAVSKFYDIAATFSILLSFTPNKGKLISE